MNPLLRTYWIARGVGWDNVPRRLLQAFRLRTGSLRRRLDPARFSDEAFAASVRGDLSRAAWQSRAKRFFSPPASEHLSAVCDPATWSNRVTNVIDKALAGEYPFFHHWSGRLGWPPDFNRDPVHNIRWPVDQFCLHTARSGPPGDDIKLVWEPSRLSLAFLLARQFAHTGDDRPAEWCWQLVEAWIRQNPPMLSVAWGCGQESTFRLMAVLFATLVLLRHPSSSDERLGQIARLAWRTGRLVDANINYARSQKNNHAISEAAGLWTLGLLFPEFAEADRWLARGRRILLQEARRQIYADGSYVQHSLNYHRVMLDDLLWSIRLGELGGQRLPDELYDRFDRAAEWLVQMIAPTSGRVPNYGPNDGAQVLPLSACDYLDYRPVAQAAHLLRHGKRCFEPGPWDEQSLWLLGAEALSADVRAPARPAAWAAELGGYYILRGPASHAMIRCHSYRDRPSQADMLHLDLWLAGENILRDGGTFAYYHANPAWRGWFSSTAAHNTAELDREDQMVKGPRFLWFRWTRAQTLRFENTSDGGLFQGEHYGYRRLPDRPVHRRTLIRRGDCYVIVDDLVGGDDHDIAIRWRLCPADWRPTSVCWSADLPGGKATVALLSPLPVELLQGADTSRIMGWESLYYGRKTPAPTLEAAGRQALPLRSICVVAPGQLQVELTERTLTVVAGGQSHQIALPDLP